MPLEVSVGHVQTILTGVEQAFFQLVLPLIYHVYHRSELDPFLYDRKFNATYVFPRHLSVEHVVFSFYTIQHSRSNRRPIKLVF